MGLPDLREQISAIQWFHTTALGNGIITPGKDDTPCKLKTLAMPEDLGGLSVLDIGAWDGFYSFEAERRGASRVLATDHFCWGGPGWGTKAGFDLAKKVLHSKVEELKIDVPDISPARVGTFDLVLFLGVLYHLQNPLSALERVFSVTKGRLILETLLDMTWEKRPVMVFYPNDELNRDPTNWWGPNAPAVEAMLKSVGFRRVEEVAESWPLWRRVGRAVKAQLARDIPFSYTVQQKRAVFHAWR